MIIYFICITETKIKIRSKTLRHLDQLAKLIWSAGKNLADEKCMGWGDRGKRGGGHQHT
jgi:hypothetical protein